MFIHLVPASLLEQGTAGRGVQNYGGGGEERGGLSLCRAGTRLAPRQKVVASPGPGWGALLISEIGAETAGKPGSWDSEKEVAPRDAKCSCRQQTLSCPHGASPALPLHAPSTQCSTSSRFRRVMRMRLELSISSFLWAGHRYTIY